MGKAGDCIPRQNVSGATQSGEARGGGTRAVSFPLAIEIPHTQASKERLEVAKQFSKNAVTGCSPMRGPRE